jgi:hypothetical protein
MSSSRFPAAPEVIQLLLAPPVSNQRNSAWNDAIWWARFQRCEDVLRLIGE